MKPKLLKVENLVKNFGGLCVTDHVNLELQIGQTHALIGPNGAGKTTLINQISGEISSDAGSVYMLEDNITNWSVEKRAQKGIGRSFQINSIIQELTTLENILLAVQIAQSHSFRFWKAATSQLKIVERSELILELLGLMPYRDKQAGNLSYGQQRQIELAMAIASEPKVLLLDEPMAGLGASETHQMIEILAKLKKNYGILLVEHDMHAVFSLADQVSVLVYGQIILTDSPKNVRNSSAVRSAYLGDAV